MSDEQAEKDGENLTELLEKWSAMAWWEKVLLTPVLIIVLPLAMLIMIPAVTLILLAALLIVIVALPVAVLQVLFFPDRRKKSDG